MTNWQTYTTSHERARRHVLQVAGPALMVAEIMLERSRRMDRQSEIIKIFQHTVPIKN
jgi:hypothetical protein